MIKTEREQTILALLENKYVVSVKELYLALSEVSTVTVRRDVVRMAEEGKLARVHGGVKKVAAPLEGELVSSMEAALDLKDEELVQSLQSVDVIILPPFDNPMAKTIHRRAQKSGVLCLDESSPDDEGVYLGVDNEKTGFDLGCLAGTEAKQRSSRVHCLIIGHDRLSNTRSRVFGFQNGIREVCAEDVKFIQVDAAGSYDEAYRQSCDALTAFPQINTVFAINDQSLMGALDAIKFLRLKDIYAYCVGGEGGRIFEELESNNDVRGIAAMFPSVVARSAINAVNRFFSGETNIDSITTPSKIISRDNMELYYCKESGSWVLKRDVLDDLMPLTSVGQVGEVKHSVLFIQHYPAHHWYQALSDEIRQYCDSFGYEYHTASVKAQVMDELKNTRREVAASACGLIENGSTIVVNGGDSSVYLAHSIRARQFQDLTLVTNSLNIVEALGNADGVRVVLTGGEFRSRQRDFVGPYIEAMLQNIRVDCAFMSTDGISKEFGASYRDQRDAECAVVFAKYSRKTVLLADHSVMEDDANFRAIAIGDIDDIVTDFGAPIQERVAYTSKGVGMIVASAT